jgi:hypothetical protein
MQEEAVEVGKRQSLALEEREECLAEALAHQRGELRAQDHAEAVIFDVIVDGQRTSQNTRINIINPTAPEVFYEIVLIDHMFKSVA